jgi:3-oxoacyl-[acyl-carrier-protein] synthase-3
MRATDIPFEILGTGEYAPATRIDSAELDQRWGKPTGWSQRATGVASRAYAAAGETVVTMGAGGDNLPPESRCTLYL